MILAFWTVGSIHASVNESCRIFMCLWSFLDDETNDLSFSKYMYVLEKYEDLKPWPWIIRVRAMRVHAMPRPRVQIPSAS